MKYSNPVQLMVKPKEKTTTTKTKYKNVTTGNFNPLPSLFPLLLSSRNKAYEEATKCKASLSLSLL